MHLSRKPLTPDEIKRRIAKFKRKAAQITDQEHFDAVIASFPLELQASIYAEVIAYVRKFDPVLTEPKDRIAFSTPKEEVKEIKTRKEREEKERKDREEREKKEKEDKGDNGDKTPVTPTSPPPKPPKTRTTKTKVKL